MILFSMLSRSHLNESRIARYAHPHHRADRRDTYSYQGICPRPESWDDPPRSLSRSPARRFRVFELNISTVQINI